MYIFIHTQSNHIVFALQGDENISHFKPDLVYKHTNFK